MNQTDFASTNSAGMTRREFVRLAIATGIASAAGPRAWSADATREIPRRTLGSTGEKVSAIGLGGYHIGIQSTEEESIRIIRTAIDRGINFMDNCWDYNSGASEVRMGKALRDGYRSKVFLMSKVDGRTKEAAARQIDESLKRLQTDHVDLMQVHEVIRFDDPDRVFAEGGGIEAFQAAHKAGKIRFIGFTGHKDPKIHLRMLQTAADHHFRFDAVQMPLNVMDAHFRSFRHQVVPVLVKEKIGVLGMKPMGSGIILKSGVVTPIECLHYAMNLPTSTVITGVNSPEILDQAISAATSFEPLSEKAVSELLARTASAAKDGKYELFKTSTGFDGTSHHPGWLG